MKKYLMLTTLLTSTISHAALDDYYFGVSFKDDKSILGYQTNLSDKYYLATELEFQPQNNQNINGIMVDNVMVGINFKLGKKNAQVTPFITIGPEIQQLTSLIPISDNKTEKYVQLAIKLYLGYGIKYQINHNLHINTGYKFYVSYFFADEYTKKSGWSSCDARWYINWIYNF